MKVILTVPKTSSLKWRVAAYTFIAEMWRDAESISIALGDEVILSIGSLSCSGSVTDDIVRNVDALVERQNIGY